MRFILKLTLTAALLAVLGSTAAAQGQGRSMQGQGAGGLGDQVDLTSNLSTMTFSTTRSTGVASSNALGGYYGNPLYMGRVGSTGITQGQYTGGFGQALYSTGTTGGMTGGGTQGRTGGATGMSGGMTGAGGNFGGTSTGTGGMGATGGASFGGTGSSGITSFGGASTATGGMSAQGGRMGQMGMGTTGMGGMGGMGMNGRMGGMGTGMQSANVVTGDRPIASLISGGASGMLPRNVEPMSTKAQLQIRSVFDRTNQLVSAKSIDVAVNEAGIARLTGTVSSPDEKRLAAGLAQITPGVRMVVNELTVTNP